MKALRARALARFKARLPIERKSRLRLAAGIFAVVAGGGFLLAWSATSWEIGFLYLVLNVLAAIGYFADDQRR